MATLARLGQRCFLVRPELGHTNSEPSIPAAMAILIDRRRRNGNANHWVLRRRYRAPQTHPIYGSQDFVDSIKARFLSDKKDAEVPQHNSLFEATESEEILRRASDILDVDRERIRISRRILADDKDKRDLVIYLLWETGRYTNQGIGSFFGLTYSAISRCVRNLTARLRTKKRLAKKYRLLKSQIKV